MVLRLQETASWELELSLLGVFTLWESVAAAERSMFSPRELYTTALRNSEKETGAQGGKGDLLMRHCF